MPMSGDTLGTEIATAIQALTPAQKADTLTVWKLIADKIVKHIQTQSAVTSNGATGAGTPGGPLPIVSLPGTIL